MRTALSLAKKVAAGEVAPKVLAFGLFNSLNRWFKTDNRRYEFERLYGEHGDVWNYRTSAYENGKYEKTLELILQYRNGRGSALEIGCSIGQCSGLLAENFDQVTSVDFSEEALIAARQYNAGHTNLEFVRQSIQELDLGRRYDVVICAEMLYYVDTRHADNLAARLRNHLAPGGILVVVSALEGREPDGWEALLAQRFPLIADPVVDEPFRPYQVCIFADKAA